MQHILRFLEVDSDIPIDTSAIYNRTGKPRSKILANLVTRPNKFKFYLKRVIGEDTRNRLRLKLLDINSAKKEEMAPATRRRLKHYFQGDITKLAKQLNRPSLWGTT